MDRNELLGRIEQLNAVYDSASDRPAAIAKSKLRSLAEARDWDTPDVCRLIARSEAVRRECDIQPLVEGLESTLLRWRADWAGCPQCRSASVGRCAVRRPAASGGAELEQQVRPHSVVRLEYSGHPAHGGGSRRAPGAGLPHSGVVPPEQLEQQPVCRQARRQRVP